MSVVIHSTQSISERIGFSHAMEGLIDKSHMKHPDYEIGYRKGVHYLEKWQKETIETMTLEEAKSFIEKFKDDSFIPFKYRSILEAAQTLTLNQTKEVT